MSRYGVHRRVLLTCALIAAACTDPTFADRESETGASTPRDAADVDDGGDEIIAEPSKSGSSSPLDAAPSADAGTDAAALTVGGGAPAVVDAGGRLDEGVSPVLADAQLQDAKLQDAQALDAGGSSPPQDAAPPDPIPSWAKPLLGRFAKRSVFYAYDPTGPVVTVTIDTSLVTISANSGGQLELTSQQCGYRVHWSNGGASYTMAKPETLPTTHMWLSLGQAPHFSSDTATQHMGFDPTRQSRCSAGTTSATKFDDQVWLSTNRCSCSDAPEVLPTEANDCRVTDPDADGRPGVALVGAGLAFSITAAVNATLKITDAEVRPDGEHVLREQHTRNVACLGTCLTMSDQLCPGGETLLRPLPANATCAQALAKVDPIAVPVPPEKDCRAK